MKLAVSSDVLGECTSGVLSVGHETRIERGLELLAEHEEGTRPEDRQRGHE
jgi:hypothetical protein